MELKNARVLVVGATGVFGAAISAALADRGARLVLTGRRTEALTAIAAQVGAERTHLLDVVDVDRCAAVVRAAAGQLGGLDVLVVASGVAAFGPAAEERDAVVEELFAVNTFGPMALVRAAVPLLPAGSAVAVVTAVLADVPTAGMAAYSASKAAISSYLTAARRELRRSRISVLDARPPHLDTGLADRALAGQPPRMPPGSDVSEVVELVVRGISDGSSELVADLKSGTMTLR